MNTTQKKLTIKEKREILKENSAKAKDYRQLAKQQQPEAENWTINYCLQKYIYDSNNENLIFKTYKQWALDGFQVKEKEKAFLFWAKPKDAFKSVQINGAETTEEFEFFPICFLFSNKQVKPS